MDGRYRRRSIRLKGYDYRQAGAYFVTLCTHERRCVFGQVVDGAMVVNAWGAIVQACWDAIPAHYPMVTLDAFVVMPNHVHGVVVIGDDDGNVMDAMEGATEGAKGGATHASPVQPVQPVRPVRPVKKVDGGAIVGATHASPVQRAKGPERQSLGAVIGQFKSSVTRAIRRLGDGPDGALWQRNYYEHIIRSEESLNRIRGYIETNPGRWAEDKLYVEVIYE